MKDLSPFIKELLFSNDCVILPGFGGFIGNYKPARIDRDTDTFHPPVKAISFNSKLSHNDGLLIGKVSEKKGIGYSDSRRIVEEYIERLKGKLDNGERIHMPAIGYFQLNKEGSLQFEPENDINYLLDSYGLSAFTREPVAQYDVAHAITGRRDKDPVLISNRRKMIWRAAIAIPFVLAMIVVPLKTDLFKSNAGMNPLAKVEFEEIQSAQQALFNEMPERHSAEENTVAIPDQSKMDKVAETAEITGNEVYKPSGEELRSHEYESPAAQEGLYHLIVGSFKDSDNAQKLLREIARKGYSAELIKSDNGYYRVSAIAVKDLQTAKSERDRLKETFSEIWILKQ